MKQYKSMPDFKSHDERDQWFKENATYFTVVKKSGVGTYERKEVTTLEEAMNLAQTKHTVGGGGYMIYAVVNEQSALVGTVPASKPYTKGKH